MPMIVQQKAFGTESNQSAEQDQPAHIIGTAAVSKMEMVWTM